MVSGLKFSPLVYSVQKILGDFGEVYLVGGAVRDGLLGKPSYDLDFTLPKGALKAGRKVADELGGSYYTMEADLQIGRVVVEEDGQRKVLDFAAFVGDTLEEDLRNRDFTINAMAVDLQKPETLIDLLEGGRDLLGKHLRACSSTSLKDDPVRTLRAVRMAAKFQLTIDSETVKLIGPAVDLLDTVSVERLRDEFIKILDAPKPTASLRVLDRFGILETLVPEIAAMKGVSQSPPHVYDVYEHSLHTVEKMETILRLLDKHYAHDNEGGGDLVSGLVSQRLGRYREQISEHINTSLVPDRPWRPLLYLAALCHDLTKPSHRSVEDSGRIRFIGHEASGGKAIEKRANALRLSRGEARRLGLIARDHMRPMHLVKTGKPPSNRAIYRFWRDNGLAGIDICLIATADLLGIYDYTLPQELLEQHLDVVRALLEAYWEAPEQVNPPALLNGNDLMEQFGLPPGPQIGTLLEALREAQAVGEVGDREAALAFISNQLNTDKKETP